MIETILDILTNIEVCGESECPATAFTAIVAAFATQGYYLQSQIISAIGAGHMEMWGVFLYLFSFLAFTIMIILNGLHIPKNVMWFVLGPVLFNWMVYTGTDVVGVGWKVGNASRLGQERVWEIAEPGLRNINPIKSGGKELDTAVSEDPNWVNKENFTQKIKVAWLFVFWDELISDTVAQLSSWVGADRMNGGKEGKTNLSSDHVELGKGPGSGASADNLTGVGAITANLKWSKLQAITNARITTPGLKDAFVEFMSGECGKHLKTLFDNENFLKAKSGKWGDYKNRKDDEIYVLCEEKEGKNCNWGDLKSIFVQKEGSLRRVCEAAEKNDKNGLYKFFNNDDTGENLAKVAFGEDNKQNYISCAEAFTIIIQALRWEASNTYQKMMSDWARKDTETQEKEVLKAFYYGWYLDSSSSRIEDEKLKYLTRDMIFSYILRNELEFIPRVTNVQYSTKVQAEQATDAHIANLGSQNKYGEIYTWARMMPYIQGILMFILAGAYPIVCIVMLIPGMHKTIITWAAFWTWVKAWDLGFAIVTVIERSVWGIIGNSDQAKISNALLTAVLTGRAHGLIATEVQCVSDSGSGSGYLDCSTPEITSADTGTDLNEALTWFSKGTAIGLTLNYGVYNGYYIYIMAALYMAVPVICGQVILQGKHGVGSLASMMTGGAEKASGGAAESSAKSQMAAAISNTTGIADRQIKADAAKGYAIKAMDAGNKAAEFGLIKSTRQALLAGKENRNAMAGLAVSDMQNDAAWLRSGASVAAGLINTALKIPKKTSSAGASGTGVSGADGLLGTTGVGENVVGKLNRFAGDWFALTGILNIPSELTSMAASDLNRTLVNPYKQDALNYKADTNLSNYMSEGEATRHKGYADRMDTMAKYAGDVAGYEAKQDLAMSNQHLAGVYGVNLMPQQKPYDIKGMMGSGEVSQGTQNAKGMFDFFNYGSDYSDILANGGGMLEGYTAGGSQMTEANKALNSTMGNPALSWEQLGKGAGSFGPNLVLSKSEWQSVKKTVSGVINSINGAMEETQLTTPGFNGNNNNQGGQGNQGSNQ